MQERDLRLVPVDPEIEKTCRQNRKSKRELGKKYRFGRDGYQW